VSQAFQGEYWKNIAAGVGITSLIFVFSLHMPVIGFFGALFIPLPVLYFRMKLGRQTGGIIPAVSLAVMFTVSGGFSIDVLFFAELLVLGFFLGELFELNLSLEKTVLYACGLVLLTGVLGLFFYSGVARSGLGTLISAYVARNVELTMRLYENMGMSDENIRILSDSLEKITYILVRILPALATVSILFVTWTNLLLSRLLLRRYGLFYPDFGPLKVWKAPEQLVWGVIGCGVAMLIPDKSVKLIALNGLLILLAVYFFQGIAVISFIFDKKRLPRMLRIFLYSLVAIQQFALLLVVGLGFFDIWLDLRKLTPKEKKDE
jgi:uncharacterized protein YybS (DUF2232 family)